MKELTKRDVAVIRGFLEYCNDEEKHQLISDDGIDESYSDDSLIGSYMLNLLDSKIDSAAMTTIPEQ